MIKPAISRVIRKLARAYYQSSGPIEAILEQHKNGNRFMSLLINPNHVNPSDWKFLVRGYEAEEEIKEWINLVKDYTMVTYDGLVSLADQVRYCETHNIPGCFVEAGTWKGGCAAMMALANLRYGKTRRQIYLFDSFQGIPEPDAEKDDKDWIQQHMYLSLDNCHGQLRPVGCIVASQGDVEKVFFDVVGYSREKVEIIPGWFQDTLPKVEPRMESIAILRLDGDLYDSIRTCLEILYPRLVKNGFLIIDDWSLAGARTAVKEFFAKQPVAPYMCYADATVRYFIKPG